MICSDALPFLGRPTKLISLTTLLLNAGYQFWYSFHPEAWSNYRGHDVCWFYCTDIVRLRQSLTLNVTIFYCKYVYNLFFHRGCTLILKLAVILEKEEISKPKPTSAHPIVEVGQVLPLTGPSPHPQISEAGHAVPVPIPLENPREEKTTLIASEASQQLEAGAFVCPTIASSRFLFQPLWDSNIAKYITGFRVFGLLNAALAIVLMVSNTTSFIQGPILLLITFPMLVYGLCTFVQLDRNLSKHLVRSFDFWFLASNVFLRTIAGPLNNVAEGGDLASGYRNFAAYSVYLVFNVLVITFDANPFSSPVMKRGALLVLLLENARVLITSHFVGQAAALHYCTIYCSDTYELERSCVFNLCVYYLKQIISSFKAKEEFLIIKSSLRVTKARQQ